MAIDAGLFAQMGVRPRSMGDYRQELDAQAANALALKAGQLQYQGAMQAQQEDAAYKEAARAFGGDVTANYNALMQRGLPKQAAAYQDAVLKSQQTQADIGLKGAQTDKAKADAGKSGMERFNLRLGVSKAMIENATTPQALLSMLQASVDQGIYSREEAIQKVADMPQDPAQYQAWREKQRQDGMAYEKQLDFKLRQAQQAEVARHNQAAERNAAGQLGVAQANVGLRRQELETQRNQPRGQIIETENGYMLADPRAGTAVPLTSGGEQLKGKAANRQLTEGQGKSTAFAMRAIEAENQLEGMPGYNPSMTDRAALAVPLDMGRGLASEDARRYDTAKRNFIASILRKETGAAVTKGEFEMYDKMYFPQVGDKSSDVEDKKRQRSLAIEGLTAEAGPGRDIINKNVQRKATQTQSAPAAKNAKGWVLHIDAQGNRAYVSPDGKSFEEVN